VHNQHGREGPFAFGLYKVATHFVGAAARRWIVNPVGLDALVGEKDFLRVGVIRQQGLSHGHSSHAADGQLCGALEELAAVNLAMAILVVQVKYLIVDLVLSHGAHSSEELNIIELCTRFHIFGVRIV